MTVCCVAVLVSTQTDTVCRCSVRCEYHQRDGCCLQGIGVAFKIYGKGQGPGLSVQESLIRTQSEAQQRAELEEKLARLMNILGELPPEVATRRLSDYQGVSATPSRDY